MEDTLISLQPKINDEAPFNLFENIYTAFHRFEKLISQFNLYVKTFLSSEDCYGMVIKCPEGWTGYSESLSCYKYTNKPLTKFRSSCIFCPQIYIG